MKNLIYFSLVVLVVGMGGCKKEIANHDACLGIVCQNGGTCLNGVCICTYPFTGLDCSQLIIPLDSFVGNYHMVGNTTVYNSGQSPAITPIDDTLTVARFNDSTLLFNGFQLPYGSTQPDSFYRYVIYNPYGSVMLQFHKPFTDDSAFYNFIDSSPFGTGATMGKMSGVKIH